MTARIILLNGVSSVGKSSIAKAIQAQACGIFPHVQMDTWLEMMPQRTLGTAEGLTFATVERDGKAVIEVSSGPEQERALRGMRASVAAMAAEGCNMVIDEVMFGGEPEQYRALLMRHDFHTVGVFASLDVMEEREKARGDRAIGLARGQYDIVHRGRLYDFQVDTSHTSAKECARAIVTMFRL